MSKGEAIGCIVCKIDEEEVQEYVDVVLEEGEKIAAGFEKQVQATSSSNMDMPPPSGRTRTVSKLVSKIAKHGYIGMLAVDKAYRKHGIGNSLVNRALLRMMDIGCVSVVLETEISNKGALRLYENLGFIREEFLMKYYLNWGDAYRLRLWYDV
jgi:ribosomal protein S18 acetylase RimI-like enzyme